MWQTIGLILIGFGVLLALYVAVSFIALMIDLKNRTR